MRMNEKVRSLVARVKDHLVQQYGDNITAVVLYGSHARGEARESSDIDLLVVVREHIPPQEVRASLSDLLLDILLEHEELVSVIVVPERLYNEYRSPFLLSVRQEGVAV